MVLLDKLGSLLSRLYPGLRARRAWAVRVEQELSEVKILAASILANQTTSSGHVNSLIDAEFKVFSQFGDDGILQYLTRTLSINPTTFIEFGVESYLESNTRLLLMKDNWRGLIIDGSESHMAKIRRESIYWRHDLTAVRAFITKENINAIISDNGFGGEVGVLSIDIDGNDYWVWENLSCVNPLIVVAEYNSVFGADRAVSVPYNPSFVRSEAHYSNLYWGCSIGALCYLAEKKGYSFVGCNSSGNNAYFIRNDRLGSLKSISPSYGFVESRFRESRDTDQRLTFVSGPSRRGIIAELPLVDVVTGKTLLVSQL